MRYTEKGLEGINVIIQERSLRTFFKTGSEKMKSKIKAAH